MVMELNEDSPVPSVSKKEPEPEKLEEKFEVDDDKDLYSTKETQTVKSSRTILQEEDQEDDPFRSITASAEETKTNELEQEQSKPEDGDKEEEENHLFASASPEEASTGQEEPEPEEE